jgi:transcriptional regulator of heat shock response
MVREVDHKRRQGEIMELVVKSYITGGKPVSSEFLKETFELPFSSATLRNIMSELEEQGYLSHLYRSSGRVPTQDGFRYYVNFLMPKKIIAGITDDVFSSFFEGEQKQEPSFENILEEASKIISNLTHYTGLSFIRKERERLFWWGTRFMLEEPEFGDIEILKNIFLVFEEKISLLSKFLEDNLSSEIRIFIGDEIGLEEIKDCSLVFSSLTSNAEQQAVLGVLGPVRMDYSSVVCSLEAIKEYLEDQIFKRF